MNTKEAHIQKLQAQFDDWKAQINQLKAKAEEADADASIKHNHQVEKLIAKQEAAKVKLDQLRQSSDEAWEEQKTGIEKIWNDLGAAVKATVDKFRS